ncbi:MAG: hypothetical protein ABJ327_18235 [Litoreibacter sp.]
MTTSVSTPTAQDKICRAHAPGKIILSGEHSVVYGAPALCVAVAQYTEVWFEPVHRSKGLRTAFDQISQGQFYPLDLIKGFAKELDYRFDQFSNGKLPVQKILQRPDDLIIYTMASLLQNLPFPGTTSSHKLPMPGLLRSRSELPLGSWMGSSAAAIAATFMLYEQLLNHSQTLSERFDRVRFCERLQHGSGGVIDAAAVVYGGVNRADSGSVSKPSLPETHDLWHGRGWYWVLHGIPQSSTGECVASVRQSFSHDQALWQAFRECTEAFQTQLEASMDPSEAIKENHRLLQRIGVVPAAAARFIDAVEQDGGAAKICGAGSIRGDYGGIILVKIPSYEVMDNLMKKYPDRRWKRLQIASTGAASGAAPISASNADEVSR